jgi:hypothetical protein
MSRRAARGPRMRVSWPYFCLGVRGHSALLLGQPGVDLPFLGILVQYRARKQAVSRSSARLLTRAVLRRCCELNDTR